MNHTYRLLPILSTLLLAACATTPHQKMPAPVAAPAAATSVVAAPVSAVPAGPPTFWEQLRASFVLSGCDGNADVAHWTARYTAHPKRFGTYLQAKMPKLRYVANAVEKHNVPGEFVFLPWVESSYRALPARHRKAAGGMWQIMPRTARGLGMRVDRRYDARLDLHDATRAALHLLQRYHKQFDDWRLSDMAYNAGMYAIKRMLKARSTPLDDRAIPDLPVRPVTHNHLAKLIALSCIVRDPQRYDVTLPSATKANKLVRVNLPAPLDLHIAARLARMPVQHLRNLNPAYRDISYPAKHLILPQHVARHFTTRYAALDKFHWRRWQRVQLTRSTALTKLVGDDSARQQVVASINHLGGKQKLPRHATLWLPQTVAAALPQDSATLIAAAPLSHRVQAGDTLWDLARHFHVRVSELRAWNGLHGSNLHLGQILRLSAPD